ncbi:hypothetical protein ZIOFF_035219 [Zingiber officinale]|uniref:HECT-type E3 ubiquitin transferase n=1 Tax=Zingiber officinale TaxID=94328 RepID=A0A8J5L6Y7_ZINOF|nr:hypothetical protein ZIOFF_035219 [Zingiber officinale]
MSAPAKQRQVSLRGASAKEISRDALLEKLAHDRELRSYQRRASAAALFIQRVWRRYIVIKKVSEQLREEWESLADCYEDHMSVGTPQEKSAWLHQTQRLVSLCLFILADCSNSSHPDEMVTVTALSMRLLVSLTDVKGWKNFRTRDINDADLAVKRLIRYMTTNTNGIYSCFRKYILRNAPQSSSWRNTVSSLENNLLITASAITLCLRPFHSMMLNDRDTGRIDVYEASKKYCIYVMTVPYLTRYLPSILLPALKHERVLLPCFSILLTSEDKLFDEMLMLDQSDFATKEIPPLGWALANIVNLAIEDDDSGSYGCFIQGLDCKLYTHAVNRILEKFVPWLESNQHSLKWDVDEMLMTSDCIPISANSDKCTDIMFYFDLLKPVHQQWHLRKLLSLAKDSYGAPNSHLIKQTSDNQGSFKLQDVIYFYYYFLRIFSILNPANGALSILNVLSFTPGFIAEFWEAFECAIFGGTVHMSHAVKQNKETILDQTEANSVTRQSRSMKESGHRWATVIQKISRRSNDESTASPRDIPQIPVESAADSYDSWDIEAMKHGAQGISKYLSCALFLFCSTYAHYLLVLDDIEFYEKQVPFTLQQQRKIAASLNTFVYNSLVHWTAGTSFVPLVYATILYLPIVHEQACSLTFSRSVLRDSPNREGDVDICGDCCEHLVAYLVLPQKYFLFVLLSYKNTLLLILMPLCRVQMFRELIKLDKVSRRMTGEVSEPGSSSIGIVVRRDHIIEDGYKQLNFLGPKLKSCINVSFISESGLPEAGLDYGGLSKEFLTDLSKAAFDPEFNLFSQTSTADSTLIPSMAARLLENGMELIEFLGRVVGKALYEGILLEYSFSLVFVQKLLGRYSFLDELSTLDSELYRNLMYVKHYEGDVTDLSLDFSVTEEICGKMIVTELKPGGRNISVRNENKLQYVHAMADYKLNRQILPFSNAFYRGMIDLISPSWLHLFNANEFNQLLSGGKNDFDVDDLRSNTKYSGGYSETSRTVKLFWEVVKGFKSDERCMLLKFVTSCSRAPLLGFKHLQPTFTIHKVACDIPLWATLGGQDVERLPSASTCYNTLKLPTYKRSSTLRNKLLYAISSNTGFELS